MQIGSPELADDFHRDGYVIVRQVFDPAELLALAEHVFRLPKPSAEGLQKYRADPPMDLFGKGSLSELTPRELPHASRLLRLHLFDERTNTLSTPVGGPNAGNELLVGRPRTIGAFLRREF